MPRKGGVKSGSAKATTHAYKTGSLQTMPLPVLATGAAPFSLDGIAGGLDGIVGHFLSSPTFGDTFSPPRPPTTTTRITQRKKQTNAENAAAEDPEAAEIARKELLGELEEDERRQQKKLANEQKKLRKKQLLEEASKDTPSSVREGREGQDVDSNDVDEDDDEDLLILSSRRRSFSSPNKPNMTPRGARSAKANGDDAGRGSSSNSGSGGSSDFSCSSFSTPKKSAGVREMYESPTTSWRGSGSEVSCVTPGKHVNMSGGGASSSCSSCGCSSESSSNGVNVHSTPTRGGKFVAISPAVRVQNGNSNSSISSGSCRSSVATTTSSGSGGSSSSSSFNVAPRCQSCNSSSRNASQESSTKERAKNVLLSPPSSSFSLPSPLSSTPAPVSCSSASTTTTATTHTISTITTTTTALTTTTATTTNSSNSISSTPSYSIFAFHTLPDSDMLPDSPLSQTSSVPKKHFPSFVNTSTCSSTSSSCFSSSSSSLTTSLSPTPPFPAAPSGFPPFASLTRKGEQETAQTIIEAERARAQQAVELYKQSQARVLSMEQMTSQSQHELSRLEQENVKLHALCQSQLRENEKLSTLLKAEQQKQKLNKLSQYQQRVDELQRALTQVRTTAADREKELLVKIASLESRAPMGRDEVGKMEDVVLKSLLECILAEQAQRRLCVVCLDSDAKILFLPCKHQKVCAACAKAITSCPYCQQAVKEKILPF